nr:MAG TPA: hypothetical protein [Caudoviricetes sp.]
MKDLMQPLSHVYALPDGQGRITRLEGEYSLPADLTGWTLIEEGPACDRLNLAQSHYLDKPLLTHDGLYRYKLADGAVVERSEEEMEEERAGRPRPEVQPTAQELMDAILELSQAIGG